VPGVAATQHFRPPGPQGRRCTYLATAAAGETTRHSVSVSCVRAREFRNDEPLNYSFGRLGRCRYGFFRQNARRSANIIIRAKRHRRSAGQYIYIYYSNNARERGVNNFRAPRGRSCVYVGRRAGMSGRTGA